MAYLGKALREENIVMQVEKDEGTGHGESVTGVKKRDSFGVDGVTDSEQ